MLVCPAAAQAATVLSCAVSALRVMYLFGWQSSQTRHATFVRVV
jgi:hypothetical protein